MLHMWRWYIKLISVWICKNMTRHKHTGRRAPCAAGGSWTHSLAICAKPQGFDKYGSQAHRNTKTVWSLALKWKENRQMEAERSLARKLTKERPSWGIPRLSLCDLLWWKSQSCSALLPFAGKRQLVALMAYHTRGWRTRRLPMYSKT